MLRVLLVLCVVLVLSSTTQAQVRGVWYWTWGGGANVPNTNLGVAFSGWVDPDQALSDSSGVYNKLPGSKFISLGGGNNNGRWSSGVLQKISSYCSSNRFHGYDGVVFDIEEGDSGLSGYFQTAFSACKSQGYKVLVTISHSAPYGIPDAYNLMQSFFASKNIDYLSPQLYTSGNEGSNDYSISAGVQWTQYKGFSGALVPSIVKGSYYPDAQNYFGRLGISTSGFVQWSQSGAIEAAFDQ